jgi:hypothetical protein
MQVRLFNPIRHTGRFVEKVLASRHLTTGTMVEKLRNYAVKEFDLEYPEQVVLGSSATSCGFALMDMLKARIDRHVKRFSDGARIIWCGEGPWPLFKQYSSRMFGEGEFDIMLPEAQISWWTDIGGQSVGSWGKGSNYAYNVHDACHSCRVHPSSDFTIMSFYPTKFLSGAEGGMVICRDPLLGSELQQILNCGMPSKDWEEMRRFARSWDHSIHPLARKGNMSDWQAAINIEALEQLSNRKEQIGTAWRKLFRAVTRRRPQLAEKIKIRPTPYLFQIRVEDVRKAREWFKMQGIPTAWNFKPARLVTIPCHYEMPEFVEHIAELVVGYYQWERETNK